MSSSPQGGSAALGKFWTESAVRAVELGADAVFIANDLGLNTQTFLDPDTLRKFFLPQLKKQIQAGQQAGARVILHSCGNINSILEDIVDTGVDCLNNLQAADISWPRTIPSIREFPW